ncbi:MAG: hypothetical protein ABIE70_06015 [bacterium]
MSERSIMYISRRSLRRPTPALILILLAILASPLQAQPQTAVVIDTMGGVGLGQEVDIGVNLAQVAPDQAFGGFDIMLSFDFTILKLLDVQQGQLLTDCEWEYFQYRTGPFDCGDQPFPYDCNDGLVRVVAVADLFGGGQPSCYAETPGELFRLTFLTTVRPSALDNLAPIRFFWLDCATNAFSNITGDTVFVSDRVYDNGNDITDPYTSLPTYNGLPDSCISSPGTILRNIDFYNGWIWLAAADTLILDPIVTVSTESTYFPDDTVRVSIDLAQSEANPVDLGGFDLLLAYDDQSLQIMNASPGELLDSCGWEYFNYANGSVGGCGDSTGMIRLVALADINNGPFHPDCFGSTGGQLARIDYFVPWDTTNYTRRIAFDWQWCDCGDNTFTDLSGDSLWLSEVAYDEYGFPITLEDSLPSQGGAPESCIQTGTTVRRFNYMGGTTRIAYYEHDLDYRGDINVNDIPYEIADYLLFINYFLYGAGVFTVNLELQVASTDVNADGLVLTLADLVYLYRVIVGDAPPYQGGDKHLSSDTVIVIQDYDGHRIGLQFDTAPSALLLYFDDAIYPDFESSTHTLAYWADTGLASLIIVPSFEYQGGLPVLPEGLLFSYADQGTLLSAYATYDGITSPIALVTMGPVACCQLRGNIDGDQSDEINITDLVYLVNYMFNSGPEPLCIEEADVDGNGDGPNIADLVSLVNYMFNSGPAPVPCQ